jgi:hypothetical protein
MGDAYSRLFRVGSFLILYQVLLMHGIWDMGMVTIMELYDLMLDETLFVLDSRIVGVQSAPRIDLD